MAYASCSLSPAKHNYGITELDTLAVVWGIQHFHVYYRLHCGEGHLAVTQPQWQAHKVVDEDLSSAVGKVDIVHTQIMEAWSA